MRFPGLAKRIKGFLERHPGEAFEAREVAQRLAAPYDIVREVLRRLTKQGELLNEFHGANAIYSVRRQENEQADAPGQLGGAVRTKHPGYMFHFGTPRTKAAR